MACLRIGTQDSNKTIEIAYIGKKFAICHGKNRLEFGLDATIAYLTQQRRYNKPPFCTHRWAMVLTYKTVTEIINSDKLEYGFDLGCKSEHDVFVETIKEFLFMLRDFERLDHIIR